MGNLFSIPELPELNIFGKSRLTSTCCVSKKKYIYCKHCSGTGKVHSESFSSTT